MAKVRIEFELNPLEYGDETDETYIKVLVLSMLQDGADWPWGCDEEPRVTITVFDNKPINS